MHFKISHIENARHLETLLKCGFKFHEKTDVDPPFQVFIESIICVILYNNLFEHYFGCISYFYIRLPLLST